MPNIQSAKKRVEVTATKNAQNKNNRSELKTALKAFDATIAAKDVEKAEKMLPETMAIIDEKCAKGVIHKNNANRKKAAVSKKLDSIR